MSAVVLDVAQLSELASKPGDDSSGAIKSVRLADATCMCAAILLEPKSFSLRKSELSINTQYWRSDSSSDQKRDKIYISVLHKDVVARNSPIVHLVLEKVYSPSGELCGPLLSLVPSTQSDTPLKIGEHVIEKYRTMNAPTLSGVSFAVLDPADKDFPLHFNGQILSSYSTILSTTLTGHTLTLLLENEQGSYTRYLGVIKFTPGESVKLKPLVLGTEYPEMQTFTVEHYSGAVAFATQQFDKIVIKHFD